MPSALDVAVQVMVLTPSVISPSSVLTGVASFSLTTFTDQPGIGLVGGRGEALGELDGDLGGDRVVGLVGNADVLHDVGAGGRGLGLQRDVGLGDGGHGEGAECGDGGEGDALHDLDVLVLLDVDVGVEWAHDTGTEKVAVYSSKSETRSVTVTRHVPAGASVSASAT